MVFNEPRYREQATTPNVQGVRSMDDGGSSSSPRQIWRGTQRKETFNVAEIIAETKMTAEWRQMGNHANKAVDDGKYWDRSLIKYLGLLCGRGYDKPLNSEGFSSG